ncbi:hypothetical protein Tco_1506001 [Tanacetum coccineum]
MEKHVVPTGRVVVPTGRYVVPAGKVIFIVSPSRLNLVPTGRILSPGSKDLSKVGSNKWYQSLLRVSHKKNIPRSNDTIHKNNGASTNKLNMQDDNSKSGKRYPMLMMQNIRLIYDEGANRLVMSADSAVTYTSVHSEARSWSIPSEDPYEQAAQQLFEQAPRSPEYVPEDHVPVYIPEPEHPEDLVPAEDEAPIPPLPPSFLAPRIRPPHTRAAMRQMRATAPSTYHSLLPSGTPPLLPIPLPAPSTSRRADIPEADTPPRKRLLLTTPRPGCEIGESSATAAARQPGPTIETRLRDTERRMMTALELVNRRVTYQVDVCTRESSEFCTRHHDAQKDRAAVRAEIEVLRRERLAYRPVRPWLGLKLTAGH